MKPSTELFSLIKSLTKSEKRFFKLNSALQAGDKNYLKIFDFIEKQNRYDEESLKDEFREETFIQHLPSEKNHLYKLILKSLRSYYSEQSVSSILKQEIKNVEILYNKALYRECSKFVKRSKALAAEYEKFYYHYELINWEKKLLEEAYESGIFDQNLDELIKEESDVIEKLRNLAEYQILYSRINYIFRSGGFTRNETERQVVNEIADYHLIKGKNTALSTRATTICYYIKGLCSASIRDYEDALINFRKAKSVMDRNPLIRDDIQQRYIYTLSFLLNCYIDVHDFKNAESTLEEFNALLSNKAFESPDSRVRIFTSTYIGKLQLYNRQGNFEKAAELIPEIEKNLESYEEKINKEKILLFNYNLGYTCFGMGDYKRALKYINELLNDNEKQLRQDIYSFSRIFNLIIHFELNNNDFIEYDIKSAARFLNKHEKDYEVEQLFVSEMKNLARLTSSAERKKIFERFDAELEVLLKDDRENVILEYFDLRAWIKSKLSNTSFSQAIKVEQKVVL
jgi:tetratricopeptide (TPR) repeat protein